ncbi:MAG TPA: pyridoxal-phosphate dependent enzyme, partial [Candidatus Eisenbacteria bacterium]|nr:pyridoxal-phosphate dependent enzyme [Candidatus Eisenbacteria bacterium]
MSIELGLSAAAVATAADNVRHFIQRTPLQRSERLSAELGTGVWLKREDLQVTRSYKVRGAYNVMSTLEERGRGVVCASAGNHAQGVAISCSVLGIRGRVFVPSATPRQKRERIMALGGPRVELVVAGSTYDEAGAAALAAGVDTGAVLVHPFDDAHVIAGQGTVAVELHEQCPEPFGTVVVPVGGGGLIAGMALWLRERCPGVRIVGAEPEGASSMRAALIAGRPVALPTVDTFVDGAA